MKKLKHIAFVDWNQYLLYIPEPLPDNFDGTERPGDIICSGTDRLACGKDWSYSEIAQRFLKYSYNQPDWTDVDIYKIEIVRSIRSAYFKRGDQLQLSKKE